MERGLFDNAGGGEMGDELALAIGRDGILARRDVRDGREIEQRIGRVDGRGRGGDVGGGPRPGAHRRVFAARLVGGGCGVFPGGTVLGRRIGGRGGRGAGAVGEVLGHARLWSMGARL